MEYVYKGYQIITNERVKGEIVAETEDIAKDILFQRQLLVKNIRKKTFLDMELKTSVTVSKQTLIFILKELVAVLQTGVNLYDALVLVKTSKHSKEVDLLIEKIIAYIVQGHDLSYAFEQVNSIPEFVVGAVRAGEKGGTLLETLKIIINQLEVELQSTKKIRQTMAYPMIVLTVLICTTLVAVNFIFPALLEVFIDQGAQLPLITQIFITIVMLLQQNTFRIISCILAIICIINFKITSKTFSVYLEKVFLNCVIIGSFYKLKINKEIANWLGLLLYSGVDLATSISILEHSTSSECLKNTLYKSRIQLQDGYFFSDTLKTEKIISPYLIAVIETGEKSGRLDKLLISTGEYFEETYQHKMQLFFIWLEPVVTILLSIIIGFVVMAIMLPTLTLSIQF